MGALACAVSGCLVSDPPDYGQTEKIPPVLITSEAQPPTTSVLFLLPESNTPMSVPFRSEDAGEQVFSVAWLNYGLEGEQPVAFDFDSPGTFEEKRTASFIWKTPASTGCKQLTLFVMQQSDLTDEKRPREGAEVGQITWWASVGSDEPGAIGECPQPDSSAGTP